MEVSKSQKEIEDFIKKMKPKIPDIFYCQECSCEIDEDMIQDIVVEMCYPECPECGSADIDVAPPIEMLDITLKINKKIYNNIIKILQENLDGMSLNQFIIDNILETIEVWKER